MKCPICGETLIQRSIWEIECSACNSIWFNKDGMEKDIKEYNRKVDLLRLVSGNKKVNKRAKRFDGRGDLTATCPYCGYDIHPGWLMCPECRKRLR